MTTELNKVYQSLQSEELQVRAEVAGLEAAKASTSRNLKRARAGLRAGDRGEAR